MTQVFLGHAIKKDRAVRGISQTELQRRICELAVIESEELNDIEKQALIESGHNYTLFKGEIISTAIPAKLISNIERGLARTTNEYELSLISRSMGFEHERYFGLEINPMNFIGDNDGSWFDKSIEFDAEFRQAGVTILSFFSEVVQSEFSDADVKVGILQEGNTVTLRVETPQGEVIKEIKKTLEKYGMVVMGNMPIENLSDNKELIRDLKTKLEVTNLELRLRQEAHLEHKKHYEGRILNLEEQVKNLHSMIGTNLANYTQLTEVVKSLVSDDAITQALGDALKIIDKIAISEYSDESSEELRASFKEIESKSPGIVRRLFQTIETMPASIASNLASPWVQSFISSLPK